PRRSPCMPDATQSQPPKHLDDDRTSPRVHIPWRKYVLTAGAFLQRASAARRSGGQSSMVRSSLDGPSASASTISSQPTLSFIEKVCHLSAYGEGKPRERRVTYDLR